MVDTVAQCDAGVVWTEGDAGFVHTIYCLCFVSWLLTFPVIHFSH